MLNTPGTKKKKKKSHISYDHTKKQQKAKIFIQIFEAKTHLTTPKNGSTLSGLLNKAKSKVQRACILHGQSESIFHW